MAETEVPPWLKALPLAPEFHPTEADFLDPIDYIYKIEAEAAQYGICKIVPPYMKAPKRVVFNNLNLSLANSQDAPDKSSADAPLARSMGPARSMSGCVPTGLGLEIEPGGKAKFTTRRQQLGWNARKARTALPQAVVHKLVWQSGETYTLDQFEAKAKTFARNRLGTSQEVGPLAIEALFWKAAMEKAISIEYANDIPGSAFAEPKEALATSFHPSSTTTDHRRQRGLDESATAEPLVMDNNINAFGQEEEDKGESDEDMMVSSGDEADALKNSSGVECSAGGDNVRGIGCKLSNSAWNMRKVARSPGSLLRFIPDEVPGVTSPMVYIGMLFSWFAWHVEDHELHSLNYLHTGAPKTWYAVPGDAAPALEEVVRVQGYAGQLNHRDAFARLGEKTTVMSPEVLAAAGVPCCRLVQNAGEYVVTFPRAYHLGFSHGFNCGEAANFATPGWLNVAREASVRRAAMNYLPMLSHQQLLYMLATSITSRSPFDTMCEKRSSRLKGKKRNGEEVVKCMFVNDVIQQNDFLGKLLDNGGARCLMVKDPKFCALCPVTTPPESMLHPDSLDKDVALTAADDKVQKKQEFGVLMKGDLPEVPLTETPSPIEMEVAPIPDSNVSSGEPNKPSESTTTPLIEVLSGNDHVTTPELALDLSTLPCAACGVLCFSEMAVVQPSQIAAAKFRPLKSHASGVGSHRAKGHDSSLTGLLPGKADKKSADFHMLPTTVGVMPSPELEETTTPDQDTDGSYDENQNEREPEIWTPDLKEECPSTKDCSNEALTLDTEVLDAGLASASTEGENIYLCEVDKVQVTCEGVDRYNCTEEDSSEVGKQNDEVVSGPTNQLSNSSKCKVITYKALIPEIIASNPGEGTTLSSLQLLAFAYDDDSDLDDGDEEENGNNVEEVTVVSTPLLESNRHTFAPSNNCLQTSSSALVECQSAVVTTDKYEAQDVSSLLATVKNDAEVDKNCASTSFGASEDTGAVVLAHSDGCLDPPLAMHLLDICESSPSVTTFSSRTGIDIAPTGKVESEIVGANKQDGLTLERVSTTLDIVAVAVSAGVSFVDEVKHQPVLRLGECVTCSLPHDSFFDSFEEAAPNVAMKSGTSSMALDSCSKMIEVVQPPGCEVVNVPSVITSPPDHNNNNNNVVVAEGCLQQGGELCDREAENGSTIMSNVVDMCKSGEAMDIHIGGVKHITTSGPSEGQFGNAEPIHVDSVLNQSQAFKGAARPRVLCLEHAVLAQQRLVSIGGANVIVVCHSGFTSIEQQVKELGAEVGANHEWRSVPFQQPGINEFQVINAAVEAEEESMPGDSDWVEQLGLSVHSQDKGDFLNLNPSSEESEDIGSRAGRKGRKSNLREKKSSIIGQWCGKQWRSDQLHPLLGGCRDIVASQAEITTLNPSNLWPPTGGVSTFENNGRSRKVMRPARLAEYTPDGRAPKTDTDLKKSGRKRKTLLDNSEDDVDEQNSDSMPTTRICGPEDASTQTTGEDSVWRDVPIASTDSFLLPHLSAGPGVVTVRGPDHNDTVAFTPESMFSAAKEIRHNSTDSEAFYSEVSHHSCSVVGGYLQRGAKLQALQKLCRQLSTPVSVPCSPLTTPVRFPSRVRPSLRKISTAKLVSRLKRKHNPADVLSLVVKKRKAEKDITTPPVQNESTTSLLQIDEGEIVNIGTNTEKDKLSKLIVGEEEVNEELSPVTHDILFENDGGLRVHGTDNQSENNRLEEVKENLEEGMDLSLEENDTTARPNQELENVQNGDQQDVSSSKKDKFEYGGGCASSGNVVESQEQSYHVLTPQTPNLDSSSIFCTESLPQSLSIKEQSKPEPTTLLPSPMDFKPIVAMPRIGRVRGKRTKCLEWKSCIQIPDFQHKDENPCQTWDENHTLGEEGISDCVDPTPTTTKGGTDPDFFPYSNCLTSSATRVRRRRVSTPGMVDWGASKKGKSNEAGVADAHFDTKQETKMKKLKKGQKALAGNKHCEELEGEFQCDMDGCIMAFDTIRDLQLHKKNLCTWKGCGKHFHMHKYLLQHRRVHLDDRPLKCPWKDCTQAFKWAWARTEHIRVHTGERPYKCLVSGCGQTFRFVSDFSRHKRNTGHRPT